MAKFPHRGINPAVRAKAKMTRMEIRIISNIQRFGREQGEFIAAYKAKIYYRHYKDMLQNCGEVAHANYVKLLNEDIEKYREKAADDVNDILPKFQVFGRNCYILGRAIDEEMDFEIDQSGHFKIDGKLIEDLDQFKFGERQLGKDIILEEDEETLPQIDC